MRRRALLTAWSAISFRFSRTNSTTSVWRRGVLLEMVPLPIEKLPADTRDLVQAWLGARPRSYAARFRPRFGVDEDQWVALYGPDRRSGIVGIGPSILTALASWERNFRETVSADQ